MNMRSGMASARAHARNEQTKRAVENTVNMLSSQPNRPRRVTTDIAQWVLIKYPTLIANGLTYSTQVRNVGAGVKELYLIQSSIRFHYRS